MKATTSELMARAKISVDLPGFLAAHGYHPTTNDSANWRMLGGPSGRRVLVHRARSGDWLWHDPQGGERGNIYHVCTMLLGMVPRVAMATIRQAVIAPPVALPVRRGGGTDPTCGVGVNCGTATVKPPRTLLPLTQQAADYLTGDRCLSPATVATFAHRLRAHPRGGWLVCAHHGDGDGEEYRPQADGSTRKHFHGNRDDGPGRGRSLWHAFVTPRAVPLYLLVAESPIDAMSAWQMLNGKMQARTEIVSTAGSLSEAGKHKLERLIGDIQARCIQTFQRKLVLLDASDVGEITTEARTQKLEVVAAYHGLEYRRLATPLGKDWNDAVKSGRHKVDVQESVAEPEEQIVPDRTPPSAKGKPHEEQADQGKRSRSGRR